MPVRLSKRAPAGGLAPRTLLLGASGQIGHELKRMLAGASELWCPSSAQLDLRDAAALEAAVMGFEPRLILNAAAYTAVDRAESEPELALAINARAPAMLARCARRLAALLVHYSTDYVFEGDRTVAYREEDPTGPVSVYGCSKLAGEQAILDSGAASLVLRTSWVYGLRGSNFLLTIRRLALERRSLRIVEDQRGSPTWSRAIAAATAALLHGLGTDPARALGQRAGLCHMSAAGQTSWHGFAAAIVALDPLLARARDIPVIPIRTAEYPTPARRPAFSVLDNARLARDFGLRLAPWRVALEQALADSVEQGPGGT